MSDMGGDHQGASHRRDDVVVVSGAATPDQAGLMF
jgi:hypothetical protein